MATKVILKKSAVAAKVPLSTDLDYGELALNYADGKLYYKNSTDTVGALNTSTGTVTSVSGIGTVSGLSLSGTITTSGNLSLGGTLAVDPSNFSSQTAKTFLAAPNAAAGTPTFRTILASDIPTLNQNTTGSAASLTTARTISLTGDVTYTSASFNGSANVTGTATLANSGVTAGTYGKVTVDEKGRVTSGAALVASDIPSLDASKITSGVIDAARLPSFVDDVLEFANLAGFPTTGETGKIYVAIDTNKTYRWSGSAYVYITSGAVDSVAGKTGVVTLVKGDVGLGSVDNTSDAAKPVSTAQQTALNGKAPLTGTGTSGTWPINVSGQSGSFAVIDDRNVVSQPNQVPDRSGVFNFRFKENVGNPPFPGHVSYAHIMSVNGWTADGTGGWPTQISLGERLSYRKGATSTTWGAWKQLVDSASIGEFAPSLTGAGATGNWGISVTGNAATATKLATPRAINGVNFDGTADITVADATKLPLAGGTMTGAISFAGAQTWPTFNQSTTGNAATATKLATARTINGVAFDGTANIAVQVSWTGGITGKPAVIAEGATQAAARAAIGAASLVGGKIPESELPAIAITDVFPVASEAAMLALTAEKGDMAIRSDLDKCFALSASPASTLANWLELKTPANAVLSVAGRTGAVVLTKADVGLSSVDNTSDANKPVSTATQTALNAKADSAHSHTTSDISNYETKTREIVSLAVGPSTQDPNIAVEPVILSAHANTPDSSYPWCITTLFNGVIAGNGNRAQLAASIRDDTLIFARHCYGGDWSPWVRLDNNGNAATATNVAWSGVTGKPTIPEMGMIPQNSQSADYVCTLDDAGKHILHPAADTTARIFTIPANSAVAYPIGTAITFVNQAGTDGIVTIAITTDTMRLAGTGTTGSRTLARNGIATALKITATEWLVSGSGLT